MTREEQIEANHWHDAQGDDLPPIYKEVIALLDNGKVCYAHRPNKKGYLGKSLVTGNVETFIHIPMAKVDGIFPMLSGGWMLILQSRKEVGNEVI